MAIRKSGHRGLLMTRQLISTNEQPLLRSPHAKPPPQSGFVQVRKPVNRNQLQRLCRLPGAFGFCVKVGGLIRVANVPRNPSKRSARSSCCKKAFCKSPDTFDLEFRIDPRMRGNCHGQGSCIQALKTQPEIDKLAVGILLFEYKRTPSEETKSEQRLRAAILRSAHQRNESTHRYSVLRRH